MEASGPASLSSFGASGRMRSWNGWAARAFDGGLSIAALVAVGALLAAGGLLLTGHRVLVERSDSMSPALRAGDLLVTASVSPLEAVPGEIVTFEDPSRSGRTITHRVIRRASRGAMVSFATRGDRNDAVERWSIPRDGRLGSLLTRIPRAGYAAAFLAAPGVRWAAVVLVALVLGGLIVRRIWSR